MHTPGPWQSQCDKPNKRGHRPMALVSTGADNPNGQAIDCTGSGYTYAEDCANARLVAAAPELLEALWTMVRACQDETGAILRPDAAALNKALGAIAKAEGK